MYKPGRDHRFEYATDVMDFIESHQCISCAFQSDREGYPMCFEIEADIFEEEPVADLDDRGDDGVVCTRYRHAELAEQEHESQGRLFDVDGRGN